MNIRPLVILFAATWLFLATRIEQCPVLAQSTDIDMEHFDPEKFTFVRIEYDSIGGMGEAFYYVDGHYCPRWATDHPLGGQNLTFRLNQLTTLKANRGTMVMRLTDPRLHDYPFIFMSDPGWQRLTKAERLALQEYLRSGGFLWIDDFWGIAEWQNMVKNTIDANVDWQWRDIPADHAIMSMVYPLKECPQVPARQFYRPGGETFESPNMHRWPHGGYEEVTQVHFRGLFDSTGQLLAVATHNTDIADGWEREGEDEEFFERFSVKSYALAINILVYATTH
jgi:hypothetical protein